MDYLKTLPVWLLRQTCGAGGRRHPKPKSRWDVDRICGLEISSYQAPAYGANPWPPAWVHDPKGLRRERKKTSSMKGSPANLSENELRFWYGTANRVSYWSQCRMCNIVTYSAYDREQHKKGLMGVSHCTENLRIIYEYLLGRGHCAVCGKATPQARWGVPMCSPTCVDNWKFGNRDLVPSIATAAEFLKHKNRLWIEGKAPGAQVDN